MNQTSPRAPDAWLAEPDQHLLARGEPGYPPLLADLPGAPDALFVKGETDCLGLPALAIVGSRNPTRGGERNAFEFSRHMAASGFVIVSGLATGIDAAAHRGAIAAGGMTVAVLGCGVDIVYPASNRALAAEVAANGALVSEYPLGTEPRRAYFPERNRLISGLSLGTLVVEAARKSGSLITARLAAEQGREVFAIPGSIHNPVARGCHRLIRDGAKLVESADDVFSELGPLASHALGQFEMNVDGTADQLPEREDEEYVKLRETLSHDPVDIDMLVRQSGLTIEQVSSMLLILELDGSVEKLSGGRFALLPPSS
ncbi:MAG: DNA-processing protein DprA [Pseudomonadota bacterium]